MTVTRRDLGVALVVLAASVAYSVVYNLGIFTRLPSIAGGMVAPLVVGNAAHRASAPVGEQSAAVRLDPLTIPPPPAIDLDTAPTWDHNPFAAFADPRAAAPAPSSQPAPSAAPAGGDPVVRSILFSSERRLALVDARIVGVGDRVRTGTIVVIDRDAVVIETASGDRRRLALKTPSLLGEKP